MKSRKGFTLVELIGVIVILAIIIAIAVPSYMKIKKNVDENNYKNKINLIEIAGQKFAEDTNITAVFVKELVENGYLEADDRDGNVYGLNGEIINCYLVLSEQKNGIFYSNFIEKDYTDNKVCDYNIPNELTKNFKIEIYDNDLNHKLTYDNDKKWWTKNNVILKAVFKNNENNEVTWYEGYGDETISKCNDRENSVCVDTNDSKILYVKSGSVLQQNYTAKSTDKDGNPIIARVRVYIDKIVPNFYQNNGDKINEKWTNKNINYNVSAYDNESGLYGYKEINETENCPDEKDDYIQNKKIVLQENGKRKICLIDNVGNKNDTIINVEKIDKSDINCEFIVANSPTIGEKIGNRQWYKKTTEIHLNALNIGISGVTLGIENIQEKDFSYNSTNTFISETIKKNEIVQRKGYIKNPTGNKKTCSLDIGVETSIEAPEFKTKSSTLKDITVTFTSGNAISGIKSTKCYRTNSDGKWNSTPGTLKSDGSCYFNGLANSNNTTYQVKKCIISNAGNETCSSVSITVVGSCNETTSKEISSTCGSYGGCSDSCGGTQYATKTIKLQLTSKKNPGYSCGTTTRNIANGCSKSCGGVDWNNPYIGSYGSCNNICGGTQSAPLSYYSKDRSKTCPTPSGWATTTSRSCGGTKTTTYGATDINHGIYYNSSKRLDYYKSYCIVNKYVSVENENVSCPQNGVSTYTTYCSNGNNSGDCYTVNNQTSCNYETLMYYEAVGGWRNISRFMSYNFSGEDSGWSDTNIGWHVGYYGISAICDSGMSWVDSNNQVCKGNGGTYVVDLGACNGGRNCNVHDWN